MHRERAGFESHPRSRLRSATPWTLELCHRCRRPPTPAAGVWAHLRQSSGNRIPDTEDTITNVTTIVLRCNYRNTRCRLGRLSVVMFINSRQLSVILAILSAKMLYDVLICLQECSCTVSTSIRRATRSCRTRSRPSKKTYRKKRIIIWCPFYLSQQHRDFISIRTTLLLAVHRLPGK